MINKPELLSPVGDIERLQAAILYGADAVYLGGTGYGMRANPKNFNKEQLQQAVMYAHTYGVRVYLTCNTLPRNDEIPAFPEFVQYAERIGIDACIVSDIGLFSLIKKYAPTMEIHISTQAGVVNYQTAIAFYEMGAKRIVLARELSLDEIKKIREYTPPELEIEAFVHGAMCMSFSGRCLISDYFSSRDANRGACSQPCRWTYHLVESRNPQELHPIIEQQEGTYLLNAKDLCMIDYLDQLMKAGISSFKIEGRAKSMYYVAVITNAYRVAIDDLWKDPTHGKLADWVREEVYKVSHRKYSTGFYFGAPNQYDKSGGYERKWDVIAVIERCEQGRIFCSQKNKCAEGEVVEILSKGQPPVQCVMQQLQDDKGQPLDSTPHAQMLFSFSSQLKSLDFHPGSLIRKQVK